MNIKELRIGNIIQTQGGEVEEVTELLNYPYLSRVNDEPYKDYYSPITLTEDWLIKLGFKKELGHHSTLLDGTKLIEFKYGYEIDFYCHLELNERTNEVIIYYGSEDIAINKPIKYAHQLQNIYFAFTGEELSIIAK